MVRSGDQVCETEVRNDGAVMVAAEEGGDEHVWVMQGSGEEGIVGGMSSGTLIRALQSQQREGIQTIKRIARSKSSREHRGDELFPASFADAVAAGDETRTGGPFGEEFFGESEHFGRVVDVGV